MTRRLRLVLGIAIATWAAALLYAALAGRVLYADGAYYVMVHFQNWFRFDDYDWHRSFANFIAQGPILLGQKLGADRVATYAALYFAGAIAIPAACLMATLVMSWRQPWLFALAGAGAVIFGFSLNYINSEANLLFGFAWLCVAILARETPAPFVRGFLLPLLAVIMLRCYEGMLLAGPLLCAWALLAQARSVDPRERIGLAIAALLFALGAVIGFGGWLAPRDPANAQGFAMSLLSFLRNPQAWLLVSALAVVPAVKRPGPMSMWICAAVSVIAGGAFLWTLSQVSGYIGYIIYYDNRTFLAFLLPVFIAVAFAAYWAKPAWAAIDGTAGYWLVLVPLLFAIAGDIAGTRRWNEYMHEFCVVLNQPDLTPEQRLDSLKATGVVTGWYWTHPTMSVLLRARGSDAVVANEPGQRFEPSVVGGSSRVRGFCEAPILGALWK